MGFRLFVSGRRCEGKFAPCLRIGSNWPEFPTEWCGLACLTACRLASQNRNYEGRAKMTGTFDGNDGNDGNAANAGGAGNATSTSAGWFFADRVDLPFVSVPDSGPRAIPPTTIGQLTIIPDI